MNAKQYNIKLTPVEEEVFHTLKTYTEELKLNTVLRVAGGWVRDKVQICSFRLWDGSQRISILLLII
jgi:hypothetical protein